MNVCNNKFPNESRLSYFKSQYPCLQNYINQTHIIKKPKLLIEILKKLNHNHKLASKASNRLTVTASNVNQNRNSKPWDVNNRVTRSQQKQKYAPSLCTIAYDLYHPPSSRSARYDTLPIESQLSVTSDRGTCALKTRNAEFIIKKPSLTRKRPSHRAYFKMASQ